MTKYAITGVSPMVTDSPKRNIIWANSGLIPAFINTGITTEGKNCGSSDIKRYGLIVSFEPSVAVAVLYLTNKYYDEDSDKDKDTYNWKATKISNYKYLYLYH